jgi:ABC-type antimicrobial peptide transport system ATPase subunit
MLLEITNEEAHEIRVALSVASIQLEGWVTDNPTDEDNEETRARIALILALLDKIPLT